MFQDLFIQLFQTLPKPIPHKGFFTERVEAPAAEVLEDKEACATGAPTCGSGCLNEREQKTSNKLGELAASAEVLTRPHTTELISASFFSFSTTVTTSSAEHTSRR